MEVAAANDDVNTSMASIKSKGRSSSTRKGSDKDNTLPPMGQSVDFGRSIGKSPAKKSRDGSLNRSMEKLPKASQNLTYTMEKFVNEPILENSIDLKN